MFSVVFDQKDLAENVTLGNQAGHYSGK